MPHAVLAMMSSGFWPSKSARLLAARVVSTCSTKGCMETKKLAYEKTTQALKAGSVRAGSVSAGSVRAHSVGQCEQVL